MRLIAMLTGFLTGLPLVAVAQTYDAAAQFSLASNPNGVWSYGYGTPGSTFTPFAVETSAWRGFSGFGAWDATPNGYPYAGLNPSGMTYNVYTAVVPSGVLFMHPGNSDAEATIVRFTAPVSGSYDVAGFFERLDTSNGAGDGVGVTIYDNGASLIARSLIPNTSYLAQSKFNVVATLAAGDVLSFVDDRNADYGYDATGLAATITSMTAVPEPASSSVLGIGLLAMIGLRRRR